MQQLMFAVCLIICSLFVLVNGSVHNNKLNYDNIHLYELLQRRESSSFTTDQREFQNQMLTAHNIYRSLHCAPPLTLDEDINRSAQKHAESLASANSLTHSESSDLGENLFRMSSLQEIKHSRGVIAVRSWHHEIEEHSFDKPGYSDETGHFTQLVWKDTKYLGVGYATTKHNSRYILYVVAQYSPAGNVKGLFSENVSPPKC